MSDKQSYFTGLKCRECGRRYPKEPLHVCEFCFGPLEVDYDYAAIKSVFTRKLIESREPNMWRYHELLPIEGEVSVGFNVGFTPMIRADRLAEELGIHDSRE